MGELDVIVHTAPIVISKSRVGRAHRVPARFENFLPSSATHLPHIPNIPRQQKNVLREPSPLPQHSSPSPEPEAIIESVQTEPNEMGLFRVYPVSPTSNPDDLISIEDLCDSAGIATAIPLLSQPTSPFGIPALVTSISASFAPFLNSSSAHVLVLLGIKYEIGNGTGSPCH